MSRASVLSAVAAPFGRDLPHPLRVGIDGACGAGKTRFADDLAAVLRRDGRSVVRLDSDGFHHRRAVRHRNAADPAQGYYDDAYDVDGLRERVLVPLGGSAPFRYATALMDLGADLPVTAWAVAPADAVLLFDCTFLQRGALRALWDEVVFLDVPPEVATARGIARDAARLGGAEAARAAYDGRYAAACAIHLAEEAPRERASILIDHADPRDPRLVR